MSDLLKNIQGNRTHNWLESILKRLPGYKGYEDMQERRAADRLMRDHVATLLKAQLADFQAVEKAALNSGGLSHMTALRDAKSKLQILIDKVATAMPGYSGFYDAVKIGPNELNQLYNFDADMLDNVDKFKEKIAALKTAVSSNKGFDEALEALNALTTEATHTFSQRDNVIVKL